MESIFNELQKIMGLKLRKGKKARWITLQEIQADHIDQEVQSRFKLDVELWENTSLGRII